MSHRSGNNNPGPQGRRELQRQIEAEFDEPLADVIQGLRDMGCTWRSVALALNVSRSQVYLFRAKLGMPIGERRKRDDLSAVINKTDISAQNLGYSNAKDAILALRLNQKTVAETAEILGVHERTVRRHYPPGFAGKVFVKTDKYLKTRRKGEGNWGIP